MHLKFSSVRGTPSSPLKLDKCVPAAGTRPNKKKTWGRLKNTNVFPKYLEPECSPKFKEAPDESLPDFFDFMSDFDLHREIANLVSISYPDEGIYWLKKQDQKPKTQRRRSTLNPHAKIYIPKKYESLWNRTVLNPAAKEFYPTSHDNS